MGFAAFSYGICFDLFSKDWERNHRLYKTCFMNISFGQNQLYCLLQLTLIYYSIVKKYIASI